MVINNYRWGGCISHSGCDADAFIAEYFGSTHRQVLLIGGAGFDPRSTIVATRLIQANVSIKAIFYREKRPNTNQELIERGDKNELALSELVDNCDVFPIEIISPEATIIGGRNVIQNLGQQSLDAFTDIIVDISALSMGISFPIIRYLIEHIEERKNLQNLHVLVVHNSTLDATIRTISSDAPSYPHGFKGRLTLDDSAVAATLWLPQLATGRRSAFNRLHEFVAPDDTCPILPFPASNPRLGDILAAEYLSEIETGWSVDTRDIVYADEVDPLDLYRTVLELDDLRKPIFQEFEGSLIVLSPAGNKVIALGALMAAVERDLPVAYLEAVGYNLEQAAHESNVDPLLIHIWLEGDIYPQPRPALVRY